MNFKKLKLWKLLAVGGVVGLVTTVPIITTACSSTTESDVIKLKSSITESTPLHIISSFKNLIKKGNGDNNIDKNLLDKNVSELISTSNKYKSELIDNYENIKDEIESISFTSNGSNNPWGTSDKWKDNPSNIIVYYQDKGQLDVNSIEDLKIKLSGDNNEKLKEIMTRALDGLPNVSLYSSYEFKQDSALLSDENGDYLRMHVEAKKTDTTTTNIELRVPTSDINYKPSSVSITIKTKNGSKIQGIENQETFITYDIGVDSTPHITPNEDTSIKGKFEKHTIDGVTSLKVNLSKVDSKVDDTAENKYGSVTPSGLANSLGWLTTTKYDNSYLRQQAFKNINENRETLNLNHKKIGEDLKIFNANFSNLIVESIDKKEPSANDYTGEYRIKITATLDNGYSWEDGTNKPREITLNSNVGTGDKNENFLINISDAIFDTTDLFTGSNNEFNDNGTSVVKPNTGSDSFETFFTKEKVDELIQILNDNLNKNSSKKSIGIHKIILDNSKFAKEFVNGIDKTNKKIKIKVVPKVGHIFQDSTETKSYDISLKSWNVPSNAGGLGIK